MEKIVELMAGPMGNLVGVGLQAIISGNSSKSQGSNVSGVKNSVIPVSPDNWFTPKESERQRVMKFYDNVEAHLHGAMKLLKPAMEIKDIIVNNRQRAKSADAFLAKPQEIQIAYYTPQKNRSSSSDQSSCCKCVGKKLSKSDKNSSCEKNSAESNCSRKKKRDNSPEKLNSFSCSQRQNKDKKICSKSNKSSTVSNDNLKYKKSNSREPGKAKNCSKCGISVNSVKILIVIPCDHAFCHQCIPADDFVVCPICKVSLLPSNINPYNSFD